MKFLGYEIRRQAPEEKGAQFESVLMRLIAAREGAIGTVTPETCMQAPTVQALVKAIADRISVTPVHVYRCDRGCGAWHIGHSSSYVGRKDGHGYE